VRIVARALEAHREALERGALLSIDEGGTRIRMLPLKGVSGSLVAAIPLAYVDPRPSPWLRDCLLRLTKNRGNTDSGAVFPLLAVRLSIETRGGVNVG
jgi:hypothetical protein